MIITWDGERHVGLAEDGSEVPVRLLRNSERKSFLTCRWQWHHSYIKRWEAKRPSAALDFGGAIHKALEGWYIPGMKRGVDPRTTFQMLMDEWAEEHGEEFRMPGKDGPLARDLGHEMLKNYLAEYGNDSHMRVISPEMDFHVPAIRPDGTPVFVKDRAGNELRLVHVGSADVLYEDMERKQIGVLETKTAAAIETGHLNMDDQASTYWTLVPMYLWDQGILPRGQDINFIEYNFMRKAFADDRPQNEKGQYLNKNGTVSKTQPSPLFHRHRVWRGGSDRLSFLRRIANVAVELSMVERGLLPIYKNPSSAYPDKHCQGCEFRDVCELHEIGSDWKALAQQTMGRWDPYESHTERKEEEE